MQLSDRDTIMEMTSKKYTVFAVMWVIAVFFHMIHRSDIVSGILPALTVVFGAYVLLQPSKEIRLVIFSIFHACVYLIHAPNTGNHEFFAFFVDLSIIIIFSLNSLSSDTKQRIPGYLLSLLRSLTLILYFAAFFHKLNWSYLEPAACGGTMLMNVALKNHITSPFFAQLSPESITAFRYINI
ncbi:MAG: hypothetical protein KJN76_10960, partial [Eudoraea sp.]|nr:hypothetical protein [Eudoraea sp.]